MKHFIKTWPMLTPSHQHLAVLFIAMAVAVGALLIVVSMVGGDTNKATPPNPSIHATAGPGGAISPTGNIAVKPGAQAAFSIHASFVKDAAPTYWTITAHSEPSNTMGLILPKGSIKVKDGDSLTFEFVPKTGFRVQYIVVDQRPPFVDTRYTFTNVHENHTIVAHFVKKKS